MMLLLVISGLSLVAYLLYLWLEITRKLNIIDDILKDWPKE